MFSDPSFDLHVSLFFLGFSFLVALIILALTRKKLLSFVIFSILGNLGFVVNIFTKSEMFLIYNIVWLKYLILFIWPLLNIYLIIKLIKIKNVKK